jgi:23S rRNA pseudouridine1911/1915/1917 synthase
LFIADILKPQVLVAEKDFLLVYKPPKMHSSPLAGSAGENVLDWSAESFPEIMGLTGRKAGEGGLLHRLDYETHGLLLIARNRIAMEALLARQVEGKIQKEYCALVSEKKTVLPGFPPEETKKADWVFEGKAGEAFEIISAFRPYGPGRKTVRPVLIDAQKGTEGNELYTTEILQSVSINGTGFLALRIRISKGFRHQIRCHLAWLGVPILNDSLYGADAYGKGLLALRACSVKFADPSSGEERCYSIPGLEAAEV